MGGAARLERALIYRSTRGASPPSDFATVLLEGLARDGGLFVPDEVPLLAVDTLRGFAGQPYATVAESVIAPYCAGAFAPETLRRMITEASATFDHAAVTPLVQLDSNLFVLELFHGRTLAFKDVAMQLLGRMMDEQLRRSRRRATIVGATSGDTGAAAIDAFAGLDAVDVFILYPHGRVSEVQRRQMTGVSSPNVHALALDGTFDDCQSIVKALFNHHAFRDAVALSAVNSINWARIVAQIGYYFAAGAALGAPHRALSFAVPTGNFGDVLAGWYAKVMGLPVQRLVVATNTNDILDRCLRAGAYEVSGVTPTQSPSMDIQVSSNFERALFEAGGRDASALRGLMGSLAQSGGFAVPEATLARLRASFDSTRVDEEATEDEMRRTYRATGYVLDPHGAIGVRAARAALVRDPAVPVVALATAHPAKFPDAVRRATGVIPTLPPRLADLMERPERVTRVPNEVAAVEALIRDRSRAGTVAAA